MQRPAPSNDNKQIAWHFHYFPFSLLQTSDSVYVRSFVRSIHICWHWTCVSYVPMCVLLHFVDWMSAILCAVRCQQLADVTYVLHLTGKWITQNCASKTTTTTTKDCRMYDAVQSESAQLFHITSICAFLFLLYIVPFVLF